MQKSLRLVLVPVLLLLFTGACADDGADSSSSSTSSVVGEGDPSAVLQWLQFSGTPSMDPHRVTSPYYDTFLFPVYDRLTRLDADAEVEPMLATDWRFEGEGADAALLLTLRDDVTFASGAPFDADVVRQNLERALNDPASAVKGDLGAIEAVDVVSPTEVRLELTALSPGLLNVLSDRAGMMIDPAAFGSETLDLLGAGTGPFVMTDHQPAARLVYERRDDYWDPDAQQLAGLEITVVTDQDSQLNALLSGQAHGMILAADQVRRVEDEDRIEMISGQVGSNYIIGFNTAKEPLDDVRVRRAINHAIDRTLIAEEVLSGGCEATMQPGPSGYITHSEEVPADLYEYDPDRARELLEEAGVAGGFSMRAIVNNIPTYVQIAEAVQAQLAEVGIDMSIEQAPGTNIVEVFYVNGDGDAIGAQALSQPDPARQFASYYGSEGNLNPGQQAPEGFDEALRLASTSVDPEGRKEAFNALTPLVVDFAYRVDICHQVRTYAFDPAVEGLEVSILDVIDFRNVSMGAG